MFCPNPECSNFEATGRPAEFPRGTSHCGHCGAELVEGAPEARLGDVDPGDDDLLPLTPINDAAFASFLRSLLEAEGIRHAVRGEGGKDFFAFGRVAAGTQTITDPPMLLVDASRFEEAQELLETALATPEMPKPDDLEE
jgi:hypothetical protein